MGAAIPPGTHLGHYEIKSQLGAGGMGEVYLARDIVLGRTVALKVLPADVASDKQGMQRFVREAKAASALNHPNILTIFEIGQTDSTHFIATEFIEGETLRQRMTASRMKLSEVLSVAIQTADALSAAHEAGIIHRDIKPENIMVRRRDGYVKVLDFGIAKLIEQQPIVIDREAATLFKTEEGVMIGTPLYMSPEQARSLEVNAQTDIWSLGVVIYEMIAGGLPFEGKTASEILASILNEKELPPLARFARDVPIELERIVEKMIRKDREERYQTAKDLLLDLKNLKHRLEFEAELERSKPPEASSSDAAVKRNSKQMAATAPAPPGNGAAQTVPDVDSLLSRITRHRRGVIIALATLVIAAAGLVYLFYFAKSASAIDSIAVLPLVNASNDPNTEYLSDGITESIISNLSQLPQLHVMARSTVFRFKGQTVDAQEVGRKLGVRAVMVGRLLQQGDQLIIRAELVNVADGTQLWGAEYNLKFSDALTVQREISREISEKLRLKLTGEEQRRLTGRDTSNAEAYQFYLRGRYYWSKRTTDGIKRAIEQFQQAIDLDPNYALGYVGLADCYLVLEEYAGSPASETVPKARAAVDRALQIDNSLAEAHASSATIYEEQWRWPEAEEEFKLAVKLNSNYATAHHWFSDYLRIERRFDGSLEEAKQAKKLDPLSPIIGINLATTYLLKNDLGSAIEECNRVITELDPGSPLAHDDLGWAYFKQRRYEEATAEFQKAVELSKRASQYLGDLGYCYAVTGKRAEALQILKELEENYAKREAIGLYLADAYAGLGDKDQVFQWLEKDFEQRSGQLPYIVWYFNYDDLRSDPRYRDLVRRMNLAP